MAITLHRVVALAFSGILFAKQKLGVTFNFKNLGGIHFTNLSELNMCRASEA